MPSSSSVRCVISYCPGELAFRHVRRQREILHRGQTLRACPPQRSVAYSLKYQSVTGMQLHCSPYARDTSREVVDPQGGFDRRRPSGEVAGHSSSRCQSRRYGLVPFIVASRRSGAAGAFGREVGFCQTIFQNSSKRRACHAVLVLR